MPPPLDWLDSLGERLRRWLAAPPRTLPEDRRAVRPRIGVALGGGFARGIAHIGVLRVLEEEGIPIDCIAGTSVGALIAAGYACGVPLDKMTRRAHTTRFKDFGNWQISRMGLASNERLQQYLYMLSSFTKFEQTRIPLMIAAADLATGEAVYFSHGEIGPALRASCAYPGMFMPVEHEGRLLVDGFVATPVPVDALGRMGADVKLAVWLESVEPNVRPSNALEVVTRSFALLQRNAHRRWREHADVVVEPDVVQFAWDDFTETPRLIAAGEAATRRMLPQIRAAVGLSRVTAGAEKAMQT